MMTTKANEVLENLRDNIDDVDKAIVELLAERFEYTHKVGITKAQHNISSISPEREQQQMKRIASLASDNGVPPQIVQNIMRTIINEVVRQHDQIKNSGIAENFEDTTSDPMP